MKGVAGHAAQAHAISRAHIAAPVAASGGITLSENIMDTYPLDLDAQQIVRWLIEEQKRGALGLDVLATRSYVLEDLDKGEWQRMGTGENEAVNDILAVGALEVRPRGQKNGWVLRVRVEDRIGPRLPEDEDAPEDEEEIDLETFQAEFIKPERGTVEVLLDAEDAAAKARFTNLFKHMLLDEHRAASRR